MTNYACHDTTNGMMAGAGGVLVGNAIAYADSWRLSAGCVRAYADSMASSHQGKLSSIGMIGGAGWFVCKCQRKKPLQCKGFLVLGLGGQ